ncbi:hypothetical protein KL939_003495 [Ogataea angusta]|nr:hypothetical protein KL939_003495 [Ogataea angusta]
MTARRSLWGPEHQHHPRGEDRQRAEDALVPSSFPAGIFHAAETLLVRQVWRRVFQLELAEPLHTVPVERGGRREHDQFPDGRDNQPERHQPDNTPEQSECLGAAGLRHKVAEPDGENRGYRKVQGLAVRHVQQRGEHAGPPHHPGHKEHALQNECVLHAVNVEHRRVLFQQHAERVETEQHKVGKM